MNRPARTRTRRSALAVIAVLAAACSGGGGVVSLQVGDCVADSTVGEVSDVPVVACDEPHDSEVFSVYDLPDSEFPGDQAVDEAAEEGCSGDDFAEYVGIEYAESELDVAFIKPSRDTWNSLDDREVICLVANPDGAPLEESVAGAAR